MSRPRVLAAAQTVPVAGDVAANVAQHIRLAAVAAREHARVIVFPELSLTGYELEPGADLAFTEEDPRLRPLIEAAASHGATLVAGAPVRLDGRLHIGAFILSPDLSVAVYTKHHLGTFSPDVNPGGRLPPAESSVFTPGDRNPPVRFDGHTAAVAVCADIGGPGHAENAAARGAGAYLAGMFVIPAHIEAETDRLRAIAARHGMAVVFANYGATSGGLEAAGGSAVWSGQGDLVARAERAGSCVVVAREITGGGWEGEVLPG